MSTIDNNDNLFSQEITNPLYQAFLDKQIMTIRIPLNDGMGVESINPTMTEMLKQIVPNFDDRNFDIRLPGWKFDASVQSASVEYNQMADRMELLFVVQLG